MTITNIDRDPMATAVENQEIDKNQSVIEKKRGMDIQETPTDIKLGMTNLRTEIINLDGEIDKMTNGEKLADIYHKTIVAEQKLQPLREQNNKFLDDETNRLVQKNGLVGAFIDNRITRYKEAVSPTYREITFMDRTKIDKKPQDILRCKAEAFLPAKLFAERTDPTEEITVNASEKAGEFKWEKMSKNDYNQQREAEIGRLQGEIISNPQAFEQQINIYTQINQAIEERRMEINRELTENQRRIEFLQKRCDQKVVELGQMEQTRERLRKLV